MKMKVEHEYCYGCIYWTKYIDDEMRRCGVTGFHITDQTRNICKLAGWKRQRWMHRDTDSNHKHFRRAPAP